MGVGSVFGDSIWPIPKMKGDIIREVQSRIQMCEAAEIPLRLQRRESLSEDMVIMAAKATAEEEEQDVEDDDEEELPELDFEQTRTLFDNIYPEYGSRYVQLTKKDLEEAEEQKSDSEPTAVGDFMNAMYDFMGDDGDFVLPDEDED